MAAIPTTGPVSLTIGMPRMRTGPTKDDHYRARRRSKKSSRRVPQETVNTLREALLDNPRWVSLTLLEERRARYSSIQLDELSRANVRAEKFFKVCHREKWRRQSTSACYEVIAATPLGTLVLRVLHALQRSELGFVKAGLEKAIVHVLTGVEADAYGRLEGSSGSTYYEGLEKFQASQTAHADHIKWLARTPKFQWERDVGDRKLPVPFERGLKVLMPLPGCRGKRAQETRGKRFTAFVADTVLDEYPQWSKEQLATEVKFRLNAWRKAGIPSEFFRHACLWFAIWYDGWVKEQRKAAGKKGLASRLDRKKFRQKKKSSRQAPV